MKMITFASFKGGAGKTTAVMAVTSALADMGKRIALIDTDENIPLIDWCEAATKADTWSDNVTVFASDDMRSFESAYEATSSQNYDYVIVDTRGGGSELNNTCLINTDLVIIPSALTTLDMTQGLTSFEHVIELHQAEGKNITTALLIQRVPVGKLTISQKADLEALSELPCCETHLHSRDAFAALGKRGLLGRSIAKIKGDPMKRISANHMATAMDEARALTNDLLEALGDN